MARDRLREYRAKRDFTRTSEPAGTAREGAGGVFVVQKHAARRLHYDFRLEHDGVLLSWAVPNGPSLDPKDRRLAVRTEDHPIDYASFEGVIAEGYGKGEVIIWDRGRMRWRVDPEEGLRAGSLKVDLMGERLQGGFALVRMKPRPGEKQEAWLLIKEKDEAVRADAPTDAALTSVVSGRTLEDIRAGKRPPRRAKPRTLALPAFVPPQLAKLASTPPNGPDWSHEVKFDGYRIEAAASGDEVQLYTRSGLDWTEKLAPVAQEIGKLGLRGALLDGELCAFDRTGVSSFSALQAALSTGARGLTYFVFDLLALDGEDLRGQPLRERRRRLEKALSSESDAVRFSEGLSGDAEAIRQAFCDKGLEGVVSKRLDAPYRSGRGESWLKVKCGRRREFVVGGYALSDRGRAFAALLIGEWEAGKLLYRGKLGTGFDAAEGERLLLKMRKLEQPRAAFVDLPREAARQARFVRPQIVVAARYTEITPEGVVRHGVYLGEREDKPSREVRMAVERPDAETRIADVRITHPEKLLFAESGLTKGDLARYFALAAERMTPFATGRPVSLVRCPDGRAKACFFQKHATVGMPREIATTPVVESDGERKDYLMLRDARAIVACAQIGAIEIHLWGSRADKLERPDRIVFDLDPDEGLPFERVREAAFEIKDLLDHGGLTAFPMVTGGKGVHVVLPLSRRQDWSETAGFAAVFAQKIAALAPDRYVATMSKAKRTGRIFVDHFRNGRGATAVCPYSPRARERATVAAPVTWDELATLPGADVFTIDTMSGRLEAADPWAGYDEAAQSITQTVRRRLGL